MVKAFYMFSPSKIEILKSFNSSNNLQFPEKYKKSQMPNFKAFKQVNKRELNNFFYFYSF